MGFDEAHARARDYGAAGLLHREARLMLLYKFFGIDVLNGELAEVLHWEHYGEYRWAAQFAQVSTPNRVAQHAQRPSIH